MLVKYLNLLDGFVVEIMVYLIVFFVVCYLIELCFVVDEGRG